MIRLALTIVLLAGPSQAFVLGGEILRQNAPGDFVKLDTEEPFAVGNDTFDTDNLYAFDEDQNIVLSTDIRVDISPRNGAIGDTIAKGTTVASHYVFFDSLNGIHHGYVLFDAPILGVAAYQDTMAATDFLANTDVTYISTELRGLEPGDRVWIDGQDPTKLWVYWAGSSPGDYIRVFTEKSPGGAMM